MAVTLKRRGGGVRTHVVLRLCVLWVGKGLQKGLQGTKRRAKGGPDPGNLLCFLKFLARPKDAWARRCTRLRAAAASFRGEGRRFPELGPRSKKRRLKIFVLTRQPREQQYVSALSYALHTVRCGHRTGTTEKPLQTDTCSRTLVMCSQIMP